MSQSIGPMPVVDADRRRALGAAASAIARPTQDGRLGLVKHPGWIAIPATEGMLWSERWREQFAAWLRDQDVGAVAGVVLNREYDEPPLESVPSGSGIGSLLSELGGWNFVVFAPDSRWAIVVTREDIAAVLGPEDLVDELLGTDPGAARAEIEEDFTDSEGFWPAEQQATFRDLLAAIDAYSDLADGTVVALPLQI